MVTKIKIIKKTKAQRTDWLKDAADINNLSSQTTLINLWKHRQNMDMIKIQEINLAFK